MLKDKRAILFFFFMSLALLDFGNQIRNLSYLKELERYRGILFSFQHTINKGSAFSLFDNVENGALILSLIGVFAVVFIFYLVIKNVSFKDKFLLMSLTLFSAGTLGNALERYNFGHVVDYFKLNYIDFPVFNAFDVMITLGCFLYIVFVLFDTGKAKEKEQEPEENTDETEEKTNKAQEDEDNN